MDRPNQKATADDSGQQQAPQASLLLRLYTALMPPLTIALLLSDGLGEFNHRDRYALTMARQDEAVSVLAGGFLYAVLYLALTSNMARQQDGWLIRGLRYGICELIPSTIYGTWVSIGAMQAVEQISVGSVDASQLHFSTDAMRWDVGVGMSVGATYALADMVVQSHEGTLGKLDGSSVVMKLGYSAMLGLTLIDDAAAIAAFCGADVPAVAVGVGALVSAAGIMTVQMTCASSSCFNPAKYTCYVPWELNLLVRLGITAATGTAAAGYPAAKYGLMGLMAVGFCVQRLLGCYRSCHEDEHNHADAVSESGGDLFQRDDLTVGLQGAHAWMVLPEVGENLDSRGCDLA